MQSFLLENIEAFFNLLMAGLFLYWYCNDNYEKLHKNKWVLTGFILWTTLAGNSFYGSQLKAKNYQIPNIEETETSFAGKGQFTWDDTIHKSRDGYAILIPKGFTYVPENHGPISLIAKRQSSRDTQYSITVSRIQATGYLQNTVKQVAENLKTKHHQFTHHISGRDCDLKLTYTFEDLNGQNNGVMRFLKKGDFLYNVSAIAKTFRKGDNAELIELEQIADSLVVL
ncbi:MAG: hypothetical protein OEY01_01155 [Desulfobulbaceae bacterium]|nr:hypothetical protein [Desulfobulbaceae bacterium]HIJ77900.1 hypothetical protein [Deltaproteobacteria bacterium]